MKVLIIEDIEFVAKGIKDRIVNTLNITAENVDYLCFADEAIEYLESNTPEMIIVDLAMDSVGLSPKDKNEAKKSSLTGWVFLKNYVLEGSFSKRLENTHCYIFSGYAKLFCSELGISINNNDINIESINKKLSALRKNLCFVPKLGIDGGAKELIEKIQSFSIELFK